MKRIFQLVLLLCAALFATQSLAHEGHGDTVVHAVMHMIETNGLWILVALVAAVVTLLVHYKKSTTTQVGKVRISPKGDRQ